MKTRSWWHLKYEHDIVHYYQLAFYRLLIFVTIKKDIFLFSLLRFQEYKTRDWMHSETDSIIKYLHINKYIYIYTVLFLVLVPLFKSFKPQTHFNTKSIEVFSFHLFCFSSIFLSLLFFFLLVLDLLAGVWTTDSF